VSFIRDLIAEFNRNPEPAVFWIVCTLAALAYLA
jgi:hypothetical protein